MIYGYSESGHLFGWDGEFRYLGIREPPVGCEVFTPDGRFSSFTAAYFLSGFRGVTSGILTEKEEIHSVLSNVNDGEIIHVPCEAVSAWVHVIGHVSPICISGEICRSPESLAEMCHKWPSASLCVCPVVDGLDALGAVIRGSGELPRRAPLWHPRKDRSDGEFQEFEENLEGDAFGRMADLVSKGVPVLNEIMTTVGEMPFYGSVITKTELRDDDVYILKSSLMEKFFPSEPISLRYYVATSVPVQVTVTDSFREITGTKRDVVPIMVASDFVPGISDFMRFYHVMTARGFVCVSKESPGNAAAVFRYNGGYRNVLG